MEQRLVFDPEVLRRYDVSGPRYTSYPTAPQFHEGFDAQAYARVARETNAEGAARPLSLYVHVPFCDTVCFYCACNKVITGNYRRATSYLDSLEQEIALQGGLFDRDRPVRQLHFGGGTPTYLSDEDLTRVMKALGRHFTLETGPEREFSIEIDPRAVRPGTLPLLASLGFNRISVGVQDVDPAVQKAVNRIQPFEVTEQAVRQAREQGFTSTNLDLIYGLPLQTVDTFSATLDRVLELRPERLAVYNYAHLPELFKTQRQIRDGDLPPATERLAILEMTIQRLTTRGMCTSAWITLRCPMTNSRSPSARAHCSETSRATRRARSTTSWHWGRPPLARSGTATARICARSMPIRNGWHPAGCPCSAAWS